MMPVAIYEDAVDIPNGVRVIFKTKAPYVAGTVRVWLNGQHKPASDTDGFDEIGYSKIRFKVPPRTGDHVLIMYYPL